MILNIGARRDAITHRLPVTPEEDETAWQIGGKLNAGVACIEGDTIHLEVTVLEIDEVTVTFTFRDLRDELEEIDLVKARDYVVKGGSKRVGRRNVVRRLEELGAIGEFYAKEVL